jgi:hypothetical protein
VQRLTHMCDWQEILLPKRRPPTCVYTLTMMMKGLKTHIVAPVSAGQALLQSVYVVVERLQPS